jgi:hypothetical protein
VAAALVASLVVGCSSSSGGGASGGDGGSPPATQQGFFRAGNVAGLDYVSGQQSGVTDAKGAYTCETGKLVTFSVGALVLGETTCATLAHAVALAPSGQLTDQSALNIMRLLLVLDEDENPDNGVSISEPVRTIAENWSPVDFSAADFFPELTLIVSDIASLENRVVDDVPSNDATLAYIESGLACAYSGVYFNVYQSGNLVGAPTTISLNVFLDVETNTAVADFLALRQDLVSGLTAIGTAALELSASPMASGPGFEAAFITPDLVSGTWIAVAAQQSFYRRGSFVAGRLADIDGEYRFTGTIESLPTLDSNNLLSRIALKLEGDTISGRSFDSLLGVRREVTGRLLTGSDNYEIEVESLGTAKGTLLRDADGEPIGLQGNWPGYEAPVLEAAGCRLT